MKWFKSINHNFAGDFFTSQKGGSTTPPVVLPPPVATAATDVDYLSFSANWESVATATGYYLDVSTDPTFSAFVPGFENLDVANVLSYSVTGLDLNTTYYYRLRAYNATLESINSNIIDTTTLAFTAEYQAVLTYAGIEGDAPPSVNQQILQNAFVSAMLPYWPNLDAFAVMATDGDSNFAVTDFIRLLTMIKVNSPTFTSNQGFTGNGSSSYLNSLFNLSTASNYSLNSAAIWLYINNNIDSDRVLGASNGSTTFTNFRPKSGGQMQVNVNDTGAGVVETSSDSSGLWCIQRINSTTLEVYRNGSLFKTGTDSSVVLLSLTLFLLAQNTNGIANSFTTYQIGFFAAGSQQDSTAQAAIYIAWNNYFTAL